MKKIALISYTLEAINHNARQLDAIFGDDIQVTCFDVAGFDPLTPYDLVLVPSLELYEMFNPSIKTLYKYQRTLSTASYALLSNLDCHKIYTLLDETLSMEQEMLCVLRQLNLPIVRHSVLFHSSDAVARENICILFKSNPIDQPIQNHLFLGHGPVDVMSIIDIGFLLKLDNLLQDVDIRNAYEPVQTANKGLVDVMTNANRFEGFMRIMSQTDSEGVLGLDLEGRVVMMNTKAKGLLNHPLKTEPQTIYDIFPDLDHRDAIQAMEDVLIKGYGKDLIGNLNEIMNSGYKTGYVLRFNAFSNLEERQHTLREKLMNKGHTARYHFSDYYGQDLKTIKMLETAKMMAQTDGTVLIIGETGTGKELLAQAIHNDSKRRKYSFVAVNCGAFPENLLESELFGYEEGAFTGAKKGGKLGLFELAHNGTLFLDELSEMPITLQKRLLRVLQERQVMRLGSDKMIQVDVRVIAATNRDLRKQVKAQQFREDLFYRINVLPLLVSPLRERALDIRLIVEQFSKKHHQVFKIQPDVMDYLCQLPWNGNVRELLNVLDYHHLLRKEDMTFESIEPLLESQFQKDEERHETDEMFILQTIDRAMKNKERIGRKRLHDIALEQGRVISEMEIRHLLRRLEDQQLIRIGKGRQGSCLTTKGKTAIKVD